MKINIREIASLINGTLSGDSNLDVHNVAKIEDEIIRNEITSNFFIEDPIV